MTKPAENLVYSMYDYPCYKLRISKYFSDIRFMKIFYIIYAIPLKLQNISYYIILRQFIAQLSKCA